MTYKIVVTPDAIQDIDNAINYYQEKVSKKVANLFLKDYKESFKDILKTKYFKLFFEDFRGKPLKKLPFIVFYTIDENLKIITIKAIFHTSQNTHKYHFN